jgi:methionine--tRNA ligase beta chain
VEPEEKKEEATPAPGAQTEEAAPVHATIEDFQKLGLRVAEIVTAEQIKGSRKLVQMLVDLGAERRTLVAGIAEAYRPEELIGRQIVVVTNLKPARLMGVESNGMLLAASLDGRPILLSLQERVPNGTIVK